MVEINCETDFVAKDGSFVEFSEEVIKTFSSGEYLELDQLMAGDLSDKREKLVQKLGENIVVRRVFISDDSADHTGIYLHSNKKIACIVCLKGGNEEVAKDMAMHIAATDPLAITPQDISEETVKKEKEIFEAQSADSGKSAEIIVKMIEGNQINLPSNLADGVPTHKLNRNDIKEQRGTNIQHRKGTKMQYF